MTRLDASPEGHASVVVGVDAGRPGRPVNEALLGINQVVPGSPPALAALGIRWVRADVSFEGESAGHASYDCRTGRWDPSVLDARVALARSAGGEPEALIDYTPSCLATRPLPGLNRNYSPPDPTRWSRLVYQMALHEITSKDVTTFEVWNEPDGLFWTGTLIDYLNLYAVTARAVERAAADAHRAVMVGGPALLFPDPAWIEPLLAWVTSQRLPLDFLSWHYYADYPLFGPMAGLPAPPAGVPPFWYNPAARAQSYGLGTELVRAELAKYPRLHPLLWIDEWNLDAGFDPRHDQSYDAAFAAASLDSAQQAGLDRMAFFRAADDVPHTLGNWGLLFSDMSPKPVYRAMSFWRRLAGASLAVRVRPDQGLADLTGRIGAVASMARGGVRILAYRVLPFGRGGGRQAVRIRIGGLQNGARFRVARWTVDSSQSGAIPELATVATGRSGLNIDLRLAENAVTLLEILPVNGRQ
jgi:hypothetical protein